MLSYLLLLLASALVTLLSHHIYFDLIMYWFIHPFLRWLLHRCRPWGGGFLWESPGRFRESLRLYEREGGTREGEGSREGDWIWGKNEQQRQVPVSLLRWREKRKQRKIVKLMATCCAGWKLQRFYFLFFSLSVPLAVCSLQLKVLRRRRRHESPLHRPHHCCRKFISIPNYPIRFWYSHASHQINTYV